MGGLKADLGIEAYNATGSSAASGAIVGAAGIGLHAAVGCASSAAGGGQCGSGAISGGLGELITDTTPNVSENPYIQSAVVGLGGGTGSALTGGRFSDGFFIAASGSIFNQGAHAGTMGKAAAGGGLIDGVLSRTLSALGLVLSLGGDTPQNS